MEQETFKQTKFDSMVTNKTMQLVKAVIPYIDYNYRNSIGVFIKFQELQNAVNLKYQNNVSAMNHEDSDGADNFSMMFDDIKEYLSDENREAMETFMMMMEMMNDMNMDEDTKNGFMENYMNMFGL